MDRNAIELNFIKNEQMIYNLTIFFLTFIISIDFINAQSPEIEWQNTIGGTLTDDLNSVQQTTDGGYILGGYSNSTNTGDKTEIGNGDYDYWIIKLDSFGNIQWQNTIGGTGTDKLLSIEETIDGGYILGGYSGSGISGDKTEPNVGSYDYWVIKLDSLGDIQWQNTIGGNSTEYLYIEQTIDLGYIVAGRSKSNISGDKTEDSYGDYDYWVVKLNSVGNIEWDKTLGGSLDDGLYKVVIKQTIDGGFIVGGTSLSNISGVKIENNKGGNDYWILKLDNLGNVLWQKTIGGNFDDVLMSLIQTNDGGYIVGGYSDSDISGDKSEATIGLFGYTDFWVLKLDTIGNIEWQNTIGGDSYDNLYTIQQSYDGGYILGGTSISGISGDKTESNFGQDDYWIVKVDFAGNIQWQKTIGGNSVDVLYDIKQTKDGSYILGGYSHSGISGSKTEGNIGDDDYWIIKLFPEECLTPSTFYADNDSDGFGNNLDTVSSCVPPSGYVTNAWDCDDTSATIHPGAMEICNDIDDNCNFVIDDGLAVNTYYSDADADGYGNIFYSINTCSDPPPVGYVFDYTDCNDSSDLINPSAIEVCNALDDNCNFSVDEGLPTFTLFIDADVDNYGNPLIDTTSCLNELTGFVVDSTDCDDSNPSINPGAEETLNAVDDNCNDSIDEGLVGIENINNVLFVIYPNPNNGNFEIITQNSNVIELNIEIFNLFGEIIYSKKINSNDRVHIQLPILFKGIAEIKIYYNNINKTYLINVVK